MSENQPSFSYRQAGVDIDAGNSLVERIKPHVKRTARPEQLGGLGGFGGLFALSASNYKEPVLISGTDGVGTKLKLATTLNKHDTIGIDLVAMCVNDILVAGAEPLFFLDYYATGKLDVDIAETVVKGIAEGCVQAGCTLIGGETAEMPGMYQAGDYDLAGFSVGVVERDAIIDGSAVQVGDVLLALPSSGPHSNGYSLIRKIIDYVQPDFQQACGDYTLGEALLAPTRIYVKSILELISSIRPHAMAHITGGGLTENIPRVLPDNARAVIDANNWQLPAVFEWLADNGNLSHEEMMRTFNCGIGYVLAVAAEDQQKVQSTLQSLGEDPIVIGHIESKHAEQTSIEITARK